MTVLHVLSLVAAVALAVYLLVALLHPEKFQ